MQPGGPRVYVSIPAKTVAGYGDALEAIAAVDDEINTNADYWNWDGSGTLRYGCLDGGRVAITAPPDAWVLDGNTVTVGGD